MPATPNDRVALEDPNVSFVEIPLGPNFLVALADPNVSDELIPAAAKAIVAFELPKASALGMPVATGTAYNLKILFTPLSKLIVTSDPLGVNGKPVIVSRNAIVLDVLATPVSR